LLPMIFLLFGLGEASKIAIVALSVFFPVLYGEWLATRILSRLSGRERANDRREADRIVEPRADVVWLRLIGPRAAVSLALATLIGTEFVGAKLAI
jgi:hypothetical protein